jgi:hypothetical protein
MKYIWPDMQNHYTSFTPKHDSQDQGVDRGHYTCGIIACRTKVVGQLEFCRNNDGLCLMH